MAKLAFSAMINDGVFLFIVLTVKAFLYPFSQTFVMDMFYWACTVAWSYKGVVGRIMIIEAYSAFILFIYKK